MAWLKVFEPNKPQINRNILFEIDPERALIRVVRRRVESLVDLGIFFRKLVPRDTIDSDKAKSP